MISLLRWLEIKKGGIYKMETDKTQKYFKEEASSQLLKTGSYQWQEVKDPDHCAKPRLSGADPILFMQEYELGPLTLSNMMKDIWEDCTGGNKSKNAKFIAIEYMSEVIAFWESYEYHKKLGVCIE